MRVTTRKFANLLLVGGGTLILAGGVLIAPRFTTYVDTLRYTSRIATAPLFEAVVTPVLTPTVQATPTTVASVTPETIAQTAVPLTPTVTPTFSPTPTPTAVWLGTAPITVSIPSISLEAPVVPIGWSMEKVAGQEEPMWDVPDWRAAGWHNTSVPLGVPGNTVLNGHNTSRGEVFRDLYKVEIGAEVYLTGDNGVTYLYRVAEKYILREAGQPLAVREANARYIQPTPDERVTFVTCHPYGSLANRLVVIAYPVTSISQDSGEAK